MARKITITSSKVPSSVKSSVIKKVVPFVPEPQEPAELDTRQVKINEQGVHIGPWGPESFRE